MMKQPKHCHYDVQEAWRRTFTHSRHQHYMETNENIFTLSLRKKALSFLELAA
jgi:hypothetical protein